MKRSATPEKQLAGKEKEKRDKDKSDKPEKQQKDKKSAKHAVEPKDKSKEKPNGKSKSVSSSAKSKKQAESDSDDEKLEPYCFYMFKTTDRDSVMYITPKRPLEKATKAYVEECEHNYRKLYDKMCSVPSLEYSSFECPCQKVDDKEKAKAKHKENRTAVWKRVQAIAGWDNVESMSGYMSLVMNDITHISRQSIPRKKLPFSERCTIYPDKGYTEPKKIDILSWISDAIQRAMKKGSSGVDSESEEVPEDDDEEDEDDDSDEDYSD